MELIPSIDLRGGRVVRLRQGDDARRTVYEREPAELLDTFAAAGARWVHVVDLDAAFGEPPQRRAIEDLAGRGVLKLELGGGLRSEDDLAWALDAGCERLVLGSVVAREPERFADWARQRPGRLVPALEVARDEVGEERARTAGWRESGPPALELARGLRGLPCPAILITDVERDGTLAGANLELTTRLAAASGLDAIVSGGVESLDDVRAAVAEPRLGAVIVGRAFYEGRFDLAAAVAIARGQETT
ncbi:MAG: HisA/HisF-related TIM barrel protein [Acidobacteriota bacterium]